MKINSFLQAIYDHTWGQFMFAGAYDRFLRQAEEAGLSEQRREVVSQATGRTLEVATGTGLNLPYYPSAVTELVLSEPYPYMLEILHDKVERSKRQARIVKAYGEKLPFPDASFDTVVATMILCSAEKPSLVLQEIARVLRPSGQYLFFEHIRNPDPKIARRQDLVQPGWYLFANGCHCNRDTIETLKNSPLAIEELHYCKIPKAWAILKAAIAGRARKPLTNAGKTVAMCGSTCSADCAT